MDYQSTLIQAIRSLVPISYQYNKPGKTPGLRIGNPYALFIFTAKDGTQTLKLHIVQTSGVSDSDDRQPFPSFRTHDFEWLTEIKIVENNSFIPDHPDYNPSSSMYDKVIAKV